VSVVWGAVATVAFIVMAFVGSAMNEMDLVVACGFAAVAFAILSTRE
jgi:hypothetical protein